MKILLATDGSRYALAGARALTRWMPSMDASVDVLAVIPRAHTSFNSAIAALRPHENHGLGATSGRKRTQSGRAGPTSFLAEWRGAAGRWVRDAAHLLEARGLRVRELVRTGSPAEVAVARAAAEPYDLIVVGAKGRGDSPFLDIGSVALAMLEHAASPVLMVRARSTRRRVPTDLHPLRVLLAVDGSPESERAAERCIRMFAAPEARARVLVVAERAGGGGLDVKRANTIARATAQRLTGRGLLAEPVVVEGRAAPRIEQAGHDADVIVMGSRSVERFEERHMGSVSLEVARAAPCSVLVVRNTAPLHEAEQETAAAQEEPSFEIAWRKVAATPAAEARARRAAAALHKVAPELIRSRLTIGRTNGRRLHGNLYDVRLDLIVPGREIVVSRTPGARRQDETLLTAMDEAYAKARRALVENRRKAVAKARG